MGLRFTEAIIQQHGGIKHGALSVLKDFGHLMLDKGPDLKDGRYLFSVPELKLALMGNVTVRSITNNLAELEKAKILVKVRPGNPITGECAIYGLRLPEGFDIKKLSRPYFGTIFGGVKWEDAIAAYNARKDSIKRPRHRDGDMLENFSTQQHQYLNNSKDNTVRADVVDNTPGYLSFGGAIEAIKREIRKECPGFNLDTAMMRNVTDRDIPALQNALAIYKVQKARYEERREAMESPAAYLAGLIRQGRAGRLTMPNLTDAEGRIVEPIGDPEFFFRWILDRYGLWNLHTNRPLYDAGKLALELKPKLMPLLQNRKQSEVESWCLDFESTLDPGRLLTKEQYYVALQDFIVSPAQASER